MPLLKLLRRPAVIAHVEALMLKCSSEMQYFTKVHQNPISGVCDIVCDTLTNE